MIPVNGPTILVKGPMIPVNKWCDVPEIDRDHEGGQWPAINLLS